MPQLNIQERQFDGKGNQLNTVQIPTDEISQFMSTSTAAQGRVIGALGDLEGKGINALGNYFQKKKQAKDFSDTEEANTIMEEGFSRLKVDFASRNDYEKFDKDFGTATKELKSAIFAPEKRLSNEARLETQARYNRYLARGRVDTFAQREGKELAHRQAIFSTGIEMTISKGDLDDIPEVTNRLKRAASTNLLSRAEAITMTADAVKSITFNSAINLVDIEPRDVEEIIKSPEYSSFNAADQRKLRDFATSRQAKKYNIGQEKYGTFTDKILLAENRTDLDAAFESLDKGVEAGEIPPDYAARHKLILQRDTDARDRTAQKIAKDRTAAAEKQFEIEYDAVTAKADDLLWGIQILHDSGMLDNPDHMEEILGNVLFTEDNSNKFNSLVTKAKSLRVDQLDDKKKSVAKRFLELTKTNTFGSRILDDGDDVTDEEIAAARDIKRDDGTNPILSFYRFAGPTGFLINKLFNQPSTDEKIDEKFESDIREVEENVRFLRRILEDSQAEMADFIDQNPELPLADMFDMMDKLTVDARQKVITRGAVEF